MCESIVYVILVYINKLANNTPSRWTMNPITKSCNTMTIPMCSNCEYDLQLNTLSMPYMDLHFIPNRFNSTHIYIYIYISMHSCQNMSNSRLHNIHVICISGNCNF